jgi:hypothetical protein
MTALAVPGKNPIAGSHPLPTEARQVAGIRRDRIVNDDLPRVPVCLKSVLGVKRLLSCVNKRTNTIRRTQSESVLEMILVGWSVPSKVDGEDVKTRSCDRVCDEQASAILLLHTAFLPLHSSGNVLGRYDHGVARLQPDGVGISRRAFLPKQTPIPNASVTYAPNQTGMTRGTLEVAVSPETTRSNILEDGNHCPIGRYPATARALPKTLLPRTVCPKPSCNPNGERPDVTCNSR